MKDVKEPKTTGGDATDNILSGHLLSEAGRALGGSAIRELLKNSGPHVIAFAGGYPDKKTLLDAEAMQDLIGAIDENPQIYGPDGVSGLMQYLPTAGRPFMNETVLKLARERGVEADQSQVFVSTGGSQGVLRALGEVLLDPGDVVLVENPTYIGAMQAWAPKRPNLVGVDMDDDGIKLEDLQRQFDAQGGKVKALYVVPTCQNPTGITTSNERLRAIAEFAKVNNILIIEDDPYSAFSDHKSDSLASLAPDNTIYVSTGSKTSSPGLRVGWAITPKNFRNEQLSDVLTRENEGASLFPSGLGQAIFAEFVRRGRYHGRLPVVTEMYRQKRHAMIDAMEKHLPDGYTFTRPDGGMFVWVTGPKGVDMREVLKETVQAGVSFVPGCFFYAEPEVAAAHLNTARFCFVTESMERIPEGIEKFATVLKAM